MTEEKVQERKYKQQKETIEKMQQHIEELSNNKNMLKAEISTAAKEIDKLKLELLEIEKINREIISSVRTLEAEMKTYGVEICELRRKLQTESNSELNINESMNDINYDHIGRRMVKKIRY